MPPELCTDSLNLLEALLPGVAVIGVLVDNCRLCDLLAVAAVGEGFVRPDLRPAIVALDDFYGAKTKKEKMSKKVA